MSNLKLYVLLHFHIFENVVIDGFAPLNELFAASFDVVLELFIFHLR